MFSRYACSDTTAEKTKVIHVIAVLHTNYAKDLSIFMGILFVYKLVQYE